MHVASRDITWIYSSIGGYAIIYQAICTDILHNISLAR